MASGDGGTFRPFERTSWVSSTHQTDCIIYYRRQIKRQLHSLVRVNCSPNRSPNTRPWSPKRSINQFTSVIPSQYRYCTSSHITDESVPELVLQPRPASGTSTALSSLLDDIISESNPDTHDTQRPPVLLILRQHDSTRPCTQCNMHSLYIVLIIYDYPYSMTGSLP